MRHGVRNEERRKRLRDGERKKEEKKIRGGGWRLLCTILRC